MRAYIGSGAGFAGDRFDAGVAVAEHLAACDGPRTLIYECLAERTLALAHGAEHGWSPWLETYLEPVLASCLSENIRIVSNMGAADPIGAARQVHAFAERLGLRRPRVAVVLGDDITDWGEERLRALPPFPGDDVPDGRLIAANAYLGARPVADACTTGADIVLTGRTTDSALVLGPLIDAFGWDDLDRLAAGTICGHLLECGAQVSGGYFADPGFKDVPDVANVGFPIAEVSEDGTFTVAKPAGTGGCVKRATVTEQLLYEMHDPARYLVPDVTCDVSEIELTDEGTDRVRVTGIRGHAPPETFKAIVSVEGGWQGETAISYAGPNALARAKLAAAVVRERVRGRGVEARVAAHVGGEGAAFRIEVDEPEPDPTARDVRLRMSVLTPERAHAQILCDEMLSLLCSGPAAGGGWRGSVTRQVATGSVHVDPSDVQPRVEVFE